jgi:CRISPR-associated protein Cas6
MVQVQTRDLSFPVFGELLPREHRWELSAGIRRICPYLCSSNCLGILPLKGKRIAGDLIRLQKACALRIRVDRKRLFLYRCLAGEVLDLQGHLIRLGPPVSAGIAPHPALRADVVFYDTALSREDLLVRVGQELRLLGVRGEVRCGEAVRFRTWTGERRGYEIGVSGLSERDSLALQSSGIGELRILGCGVFEQWSGRGMRPD